MAAASKGQKVLVALSGGVDSAMAAYALKQAGYDVSAAYMRTWMDEEGRGDLFANCPAAEDIESARAVAKFLEIDFEVINLVREYREHVVNYLVEGYRNGITPNPDIMCNRHMKFGVFQRFALDQGFDLMATGHYVRKEQDPAGNYDLLEGLDSNKDQSYFLCLLEQHQIARALFPIGNWHKPQLRQKALEINLPNAQRKDSQGICFLGRKVRITDFLAQFIEDRPGPIINAEGTQVGEHRGLHRFTIGQRRGIGVPSNNDFKNYVVIAKDYKANILHVAFEQDDTSSAALYTQNWDLCNLTFTNQPITAPCTLQGKPRYRDPSVTLNFTPTDSGKAHIHFTEPQRALAKGQVLALYNGPRLLGGGIYT